MAEEMIKNPQELSLSQKDKDLFEYLCTSISEKITERKPIYEKTILDFSLLVARLFQNGALFDLPACFDQLTECVEDYWFYSAHEDENKELSLSYVRIYQTINMFKVYSANSKIENAILSASIKLKKHFELLQVVHDKPGITHKDLSEILHLSPSNLTHRTSELEEQGFLYASRLGQYKYYTLSSKGLSLYHQLSSDKESALSTRWSPKRTRVYSYLIELLSDGYYKHNSTVDTAVFEQIAKALNKYNEAKIENVWNRIKNTNTQDNDNSTYYIGEITELPHVDSKNWLLLNSIAEREAISTDNFSRYLAKSLQCIKNRQVDSDELSKEWFTSNYAY